MRGMGKNCKQTQKGKWWTNRHLHGRPALEEGLLVHSTGDVLVVCACNGNKKATITATKKATISTRAEKSEHSHPAHNIKKPRIPTVTHSHPVHNIKKLRIPTGTHSHPVHNIKKPRIPTGTHGQLDTSLPCQVLSLEGLEIPPSMSVGEARFASV